MDSRRRGVPKEMLAASYTMLANVDKVKQEREATRSSSRA